MIKTIRHWIELTYTETNDGFLPMFKLYDDETVIDTYILHGEPLVNKDTALKYGLIDSRNNPGKIEGIFSRSHGITEYI